MSVEVKGKHVAEHHRAVATVTTVTTAVTRNLSRGLADLRAAGVGWLLPRAQRSARAASPQESVPILQDCEPQGASDLVI